MIMHISIYFLLYINFVIYLFLAALGVHCCARAFSSCGEQRLCSRCSMRASLAVASLVAEHRV